VVAVAGKAGRYMVRVKDDLEASARRRAALERALRDDLGPEIVSLRTAASVDRIMVTARTAIEPHRLRAAVERSGYGVLSVTDISAAAELRYSVTLRGAGDSIVARVRDQLGERAGNEPLRVEWVGPKAGKQLRDAAIKAGLYAMALILVYVALRFDLRFAPGAIVALFHDAMIVVGVYALTQKEFTLGTVAAILTVIGYSINDTIVIYDRVRENLARSRGAPLALVLNQSLNDTLSRTVITSSVTLLSIVGFFIWGTPVVKDIAFALAVGFVSGTYSTVCIAVPLVEWMDRKL
jgi:preprotein translocase subunit SecF